MGDTSLFIEPFYKLNDPSNKTATTVFRKAYCDARQIGDKEDFTLLFNTAVVQGDAPATGATYLTRESFKDSAGALNHLKNVSAVFARALGVASPTGFSMLGTQTDLDAMADEIKKLNVVDFVLDPRSFRRASLTRRQDYFALDFFLKLNDPADLPKFQQSWGECRDLAYSIPGVLSLGMGVHKSTDGKTVMMQLKETYKDVAAYNDWGARADKYAKAFFGLAKMSTHPNPFSMTGHPLELEKVAQDCKDVGCVQYTLDNCTDADSGAENLAAKSDNTASEVEDERYDNAAPELEDEPYDNAAPEVEDERNDNAAPELEDERYDNAASEVEDERNDNAASEVEDGRNNWDRERVSTNTSHSEPPRAPHSSRVSEVQTSGDSFIDTTTSSNEGTIIV